MRHFLIATALIFTAATFAFAPGHAQQPQLPNLRPPPPPPIKPYQPVKVAPPANFSDAGFVAFRKQLADVAEHKDRAALAKLVVAKGFFWMQDKDLADKSKPGIDNLAKAIDLDAKDGPGWTTLAGYAADPTGEPLQDHPNIVCGPAEPNIDAKAFEALIKATQTEPPEWGYPSTDGLEVRAAAKPDAPVIDKLGLVLVHVLPDSAPPGDANAPVFLHVATPSGKSGFVPLDAINSLAGDQMCYAKDGGSWKITGYFGGVSQ
jgi:hypothetical protein